MENEKLKIISILHHPPLPAHVKLKDPEDYNKYFGHMEYVKIDTFPHWVGFFRGDWHHKLARDITARTGKYQIECWRPYGNKIDRVYSKHVDGILHKVFPLQATSLPYFGSWFKSREMLAELKNEIKNGKVLIHIHDGHSRFANWLILRLKNYQVPIIYQQRSSCFGIYKYKLTKKKYNLTNLFVHWKQLRALKYIDYNFTVSQVEKKYLQEKLNVQHVDFMKDGVDYDFFKPAEDKEKTRKELGLPIDKRIILYVGRFYSDKNVDALIKCYNKLKQNYDDVVLLLVGGYKTDQFYNFAKESGAVIVERIRPDRLAKYYQAADIFVVPAINYTVMNFAGFGTAQAESVACGLPIATNNIKHFPGTIEERGKIGAMLGSEDEFEKNLMEMLDNLDHFKECRQVSRKYFDVEMTTKIWRDKYGELFKKYYGEV